MEFLHIFFEKVLLFFFTQIEKVGKLRVTFKALFNQEVNNEQIS